MDWPYRFPRPADVIAADAERFQAVPAAERVRQLAELADLADRMLAESPRRAELESVTLAAEVQWRTAHRRVFDRDESC